MDDGDVVLMNMDYQILLATAFIASLVMGLFIRNLSAFMNSLHKREKPMG